MLIPEAQAGLVDFSTGLLEWVEKRFGSQAIPRLKNWQGLVRKLGSPTPEHGSSATFQPHSREEAETLKRVNYHFNRIPYNTDLAIWGVNDYWATPVEMIGINAGDCEDYAIAKYLSLKEIGIPVDRLRITYVRALTFGVTHMVLAYYPTPDSDPFILDNMVEDIKEASTRTDLQPVFSFNEDDLWDSATSLRHAGGGSQIRMWKGLLQKLNNEQKM